MLLHDPTKVKLADADCVCLTPDMPEGLGRLYHSSYANNWVWEIPPPLVIVQMNGDTDDRRLVDGGVVYGHIHFPMPDTPDGCLPDNVYLALVQSVATFMTSGVNVLVHCAAGVSRSGYISLGVLMALGELSFRGALDLSRQHRPVISPNTGFRAQMDRLADRLHAIGGW